MNKPAKPRRDVKTQWIQSGPGAQRGGGDHNVDVVRQLGQRIRELRVGRRTGRMTQEDLAERADISVSFLSMIERGERAPHIETLASLATALEVHIADLFAPVRGEGPMPRRKRTRA